MLGNFVSWWIARIAELLPRSWIEAFRRVPDGIVAVIDDELNVAIWLRHHGRQDKLTLGAAARLTPRKPVSVRPPDRLVLEKHHVVPTLPRREMTQMLRHELGRITPFTADELFWGWDGTSRTGDKSRTHVVLTMVPKAAIAPALESLSQVGIRPRFIEAGQTERPRVLPVATEAGVGINTILGRGLAWTCASLGVIVLVLPVLLQEFALYQTNAEIDGLRPAISEADSLRRGLNANGAGQQVLAEETQRTGDLLQVLATVTRILPDDTYLTDFSLRNRQMTLGGRSAAAAHLIPALSADPAIRAAAFAAPVTRIDGAATDVFSIRADVAP